MSHRPSTRRRGERRVRAVGGAEQDAAGLLHPRVRSQPALVPGDADAHRRGQALGVQHAREDERLRETRDADGRVPTDNHLRTELPGVFAAGSLRADSLYQAASAAGDGAAAAKAAHRYLSDGIWREGG